MNKARVAEAVRGSLHFTDLSPLGTNRRVGQPRKIALRSRGRVMNRKIHFTRNGFMRYLKLILRL